MWSSLHKKANIALSFLSLAFSENLEDKISCDKAQASR